MTRSPDSGKFRLQNQLRTWSELKRRAAAEKAESSSDPKKLVPDIPARRWAQESEIRSPDSKTVEPTKIPSKSRNSDAAGRGAIPTSGDGPSCIEEDEEAFPKLSSSASSATNQDPRDIEKPNAKDTGGILAEDTRQTHRPRPIPSYMAAGRDGGGSASGAATPDTVAEANPDLESANAKLSTHGASQPSESEDDSENEPNPGSRSNAAPSEEVVRRWTEESGMGSGARADALGDYSEDEDSVTEHDAKQTNYDGRRLQDLAEAERQDKSLRGSVY